MSGLTGAPGRAVRSWESFWFRRVDDLPFRVLRVGVAGVALLSVLEIGLLLPHFYVDGGRFPLWEAREVNQGALISLLFHPVLGSLPSVVALYGTLVAALVALAAGWRSRVAAPLSFLLLLWFQTRMPLYLDGGDEVLRFSLLYLALGILFAPAREGRMSVWPLRLFQLQVALLYCLSGYWKLGGETWWDGSAVYLAAANPSFTRFGLPQWEVLYPLFLAAAILVAWWEFLFPLLVVWRRTRGAALLFGLAVHLGIFVTMNLSVFALAMLATYPAFLRAETFRRWRGTVMGVRERSWGAGPGPPRPAELTDLSEKA